MDRVAAYQRLVTLRKSHVFPSGLLNPATVEGGRFDSDEVGPWSRWQGDLNADVVVVGQDWGDRKYFVQNDGLDNDTERTCNTLREMARAAGWDLGVPSAPVRQPLFFTNAVLGIREADGKSGDAPKAWVEDSLPFLIELLEIIKPRAVVSLGASAYQACRLALYGRERDAKVPLGAPLSDVLPQNPILHPSGTAWFAFYHCSQLGLANRSRPQQLQDWSALGKWLGQTPR